MSARRDASEELAMQITAGLFADVEAAYRQERISASFKEHAAGRHLHLLRRNRHDPGGHAAAHGGLRTA
jgi:hypothetical protein